MPGNTIVEEIKTRRVSLTILRELMEKHGADNVFLPLLPFVGKAHNGEKIRRSQLDLCSKLNNCAVCDDLQVCLKHYDSVCYEEVLSR
jgi:hypothetical protein